MVALGYKGSTYGYTDQNNNYFGEVVCQNALLLGEKNYLEAAWGKSTKDYDSFSEKQTFYQESSWKYDGSIYGGISGGAGFKLFGLGEEFEYSALAGADISRDYSTSTEKETKWGIELSEDWGPDSPGDGAGPKSVVHYVFRIYFLPVPASPSILPANHWTQELFDFSPPGNTLTPQIDKNSACWKIFYVVTHIEYLDGTVVTYDGQLDRPSVYENKTLRAKTRDTGSQTAASDATGAGR